MYTPEERKHLQTHHTLGSPAYEAAWVAVYEAAEARRYAAYHHQPRLDGVHSLDALHAAEKVLAETSMGNWMATR